MNTQQESIHHRLHRRQVRVFDLLALLFLAAIAISLLTIGIRYIRFLFLDIRQVEHATTVIEQDCQMLVARSEYLIYAGQEGEFVPTLVEGQRVKEGEQIGYIQWDDGTQYPVQSSHTGLISYQIDGWETALTLEGLDRMDWLGIFSSIEVAEEDEIISVDPPALSSGRIVAKVVDNLVEPVLVIRGIDLSTELEVGDSFQFFFSEDVEKKTPLKATIIEHGQLADGTYYIFARPSQMDDHFYAIRYDEISLVNQIITGLTIPATAILWDEETKSHFVYCCSRDRIVRSEVTIQYKSDEIAVVEGLTLGDAIVANPERAKEGQRIFHKQDK